MSKTPYNFSMNFFNIFMVILNGKFKILLITLIFTLAGIIYASKQSVLYSISINLQTVENSVFDKYNYPADIKGKIYSPDINEQSVFENLFYRTIDYEEISLNLKNNSFVEEHLKGYSGVYHDKELLNHAQNFEIEYIPRPKKPKNPLEKASLKFSFKWHDITEGIRILDSLIKQNLASTKENLLRQVKDSAIVINLIKTSTITKLKLQAEQLLEIQKKNNDIQIIALEDQLKLLPDLNMLVGVSSPILRIEKIKNKRRISALQEQHDIAKELEIERPVYLSDNFYPTGYFLGTKALKKEINILTVRSDKELILVSSYYEDVQNKFTKLKEKIDTLKRQSNGELFLIDPKYIAIQKGINEAQNNLILSRLKLDEIIKVLRQDDLANWLSYNILSADIELLTVEPKKFGALSLVTGLIIGLFYVIILDLYRELKIKKKN